MNRATLADELIDSLWNDLIARWFPACVDPRGGFFQKFRRDWTLEDDGLRGVVFQARMTWLSATLAETGHSRAGEFRGYARHGLDFLESRLVEAETGSTLWVVDADGIPCGDYADQRHSYGASFVLYALAAVYRVTDEARALSLAKQVFHWLETRVHDEEHGGYFEWTDAAGQPLLKAPADWSGPNRDAIGTRYGLKSQNTHLHLLEAFTELARVWRDPLLLERLAEASEILTKRLLHADGWLYQYAQPDWSPVPGLISYGHDIEAAHLLMAASRELHGEVTEQTAGVARKLIDYVLCHGLDGELGGLFNTGTPEGEVFDDTKIWWVQAEALLGLAWGLELPGADVAAYAEALTGVWRWIRGRQIDSQYGGWFGYLSRDGKPLHYDTKGDMWKAAYHDGRALLFAARGRVRWAARR
ncbi:AGE family epimerase/isomerase [Fimbriimonas ginsengisoli]|uniref:N-acylglucosamine 2-epimerase superfamily n=1 Tax=Fimbriimonas ginsengisoli Gsoil 348 TaxID=661478 RepID=A0A068NRR8_FIMGI|nr:AGE family epimerase/isomerase [Fimbriimonas ginsengisoli]AIE84314.1 N-acylglucosamine 2-epimerase superfamily [Fimbriimonas ginsengisoli Gsoil 348]